MTAAGSSAKSARRPGQRPGASRDSATRKSTGRDQARRTGKQQRSRRRGIILWSAALLVIAAAVTVAMLTTGSGSSSSSVRAAPEFTLPSTDGQMVSLASYRGHAVVLYFNEGVGCGACFDQMREIEQHAAEFTKAGITILPIVMNPAAQVRTELAAYGVRTPYLIDTDGSVSSAYGVLGKGMHAGLPGHGFVLIDATGTQRWYGEYPSMFVSAKDLLQQIKAHLPR